MKRARLSSALPAAVLISGMTVFLWQIRGENPGRAWQAFLINLLFFSAIAQAGPVFVAIYHLTEARWGGPVAKLALGLGSFLPVSIILFAILFAGFPYLPAGSAESPAREAWFYHPFFFGRDLVGLGLLYLVSLVFLYRFLNLGRRAGGSLTILASLVVGLYALVFSLIGVDLVMGLDHRWYSTLFGGYFFISSFYTGLSAITICAALAKIISGHGEVIQKTHLWDLAKLLFAFCILTAYFLWSQFLVIWYGNLPDEAGFFTLRMKNEVWAGLTWTALILIFAIPFFALLGQRPKQSRAVLLSVSTLVLLGMWLERYVLIAPSLGITGGVSLGWTEAATTVTFLAALMLSYSFYLRFILPRGLNSGAAGSRERSEF